VNEALRAHVTSAKFVLTLGATHIAALVWVERQLRHNKSTDEKLQDRTLAPTDPPLGHPLRRAFRHSGMGGLITRGLILHHLPAGYDQPGVWGGHLKPAEIWTITRAGRAVIDLLVEAGIWSEFADALPAEIDRVVA
jgi:hypothetical protein